MIRTLDRSPNKPYPSNVEHIGGWSCYARNKEKISQLIPGKKTIGQLEITCPGCGYVEEEIGQDSVHGVHLYCDQCGLHMQPFGNSFYAWREDN